MNSQVAEPCRAEYGKAIQEYVRSASRWVTVQIVGGADCGQERGDVAGAEAKLIRGWRRKEPRLGLREVRHRKGEKGREKRFY